MGYYGVVHTDSSYASADVQKVNRKESINIQDKISRLRQAESEVYGQIFPGCRTIEDFLIKLKELFNNQNDIETFRFFENNRIKAALTHRFGTTTKKKEDVIITINSHGTELDLASLLKGINVTAEGDKINLGVDPQEAKKAINKLFNTRFKYGSASTRKLNQFLEDRNLLTETFRYIDNDNLITVSSSGTFASSTLTKRMLVPGSIFSYTANDIKAAIEDGDIELRRELESARQEIYFFIVSESGYNQASQEMRQAIDDVWNRNIAGSLMNLAHFEKGGYLDYLAGAFGEFQAALLFSYVDLKAKGSSLAMALISDTLKKGEQAKADVTFLGKIGIQVKNFNTFSADKGFSQLKVNTHPGKLVQFPDFNFEKTGFLDFLANYYFNLTFQESVKNAFAGIQEGLQEFFAEVSNLAVSDAVGDLVSFYFIEGKNFVPGSYILEGWANQQIKATPIEITGPTSLGKYDEEFKEKYASENGHEVALLSKYWRGNHATSWYPRNPQNSSAYSNLVNRQISIRSSFDYRTLTSSGRFSLW